VVSPEHRFGHRDVVSIKELGMETFIAHNVVSPYREAVLKEFKKHNVELNMDIEMPTIETIRKLVQANLGVAFLPRMCVEPELLQGNLCSVKVRELAIERKVHLLRPSRRAMSYAANAFLEVVG
jgi:DNA-binding transcriptional LysR family regulator